MAVATAQIELLPTLESAQDVTGPFTDGDTLVRKNGVWVPGRKQTHTIQIAGLWGLQNNEINAIGISGYADTNHLQDLGDSGPMGTPTDPLVIDNGNAGGFMAPADMKPVRYRVLYRQNNADATEWGFLFFKQLPVHGSNIGSPEVLLDDVAANINRAGPTNLRQYTTITDFEDVTINAGEFICMAARCPTAPTNRNLNIISSVLELEFV